MDKVNVAMIPYSWSILIGVVIRFISNLISALFTLGYADTGTRGLEGLELENCGSCSRCISNAHKHFEAKCSLIENYIADNLAVYERLDKILQLQTQNITSQLILLQNMSNSTEHLGILVKDCLETHTSCVNQFLQEVESLRAKQEIEQKMEIARIEVNTDNFKKNLLVNMVHNEKHSLTELLQE